PAAELVVRYLEAEQSSRFPGRELLERRAVEAIGAMYELLDQSIRDAQIARELLHGFAARDEAFGAVLHDKAVAALAPELPAESLRRFVERHAIPGVRAPVGHAEPAQAAADDRDMHTDLTLAHFARKPSRRRAPRDPSPLACAR